MMSKRNRSKRSTRNWDDSVNDLYALRASPEDLKRRHELHISKNLAIIKQHQVDEKLQSSLRRHRLNYDRPPSRSAIIKEVLHGSTSSEQQLNATLERSDLLMSRAQSMLGGDVSFMHRAVPTITLAPNATRSDLESSALLETYSRPTSSRVLSSDKTPNTLNDIEPTKQCPSQTPEEPRDENVQADDGFGAPEDCNAATDHEKNLHENILEAIRSELKLYETHTAKCTDTDRPTPSPSKATESVILSELQNKTSPHKVGLPLKSFDSAAVDNDSGYSMTLAHSVLQLIRRSRQVEEQLASEKACRLKLEERITQLASLLDAVTCELMETHLLCESFSSAMTHAKKNLCSGGSSQPTCNTGEELSHVSKTKPHPLASDCDVIKIAVPKPTRHCIGELSLSVNSSKEN